MLVCGGKKVCGDMWPSISVCIRYDRCYVTYINALGVRYKTVTTQSLPLRYTEGTIVIIFISLLYGNPIQYLLTLDTVFEGFPLCHLLI